MKTGAEEKKDTAAATEGGRGGVKAVGLSGFTGFFGLRCEAEEIDDRARGQADIHDRSDFLAGKRMLGGEVADAGDRAFHFWISRRRFHKECSHVSEDLRYG